MTMSRKTIESLGISRRIGRGGEIRTHDPLRPRQVRYQAALRPDILLLLILTVPASRHAADHSTNAATRMPAGVMIALHADAQIQILETKTAGNRARGREFAQRAI